MYFIAVFCMRIIMNLKIINCSFFTNLKRLEVKSNKNVFVKRQSFDTLFLFIDFFFLETLIV